MAEQGLSKAEIARRLDDWPVEAFVHDLNTLKYFFYEMDVKSGCPSLPQMVAEGIAIPEATKFSESLKQLARKVLDGGPPALTTDERDRKRYGVTDLVDSPNHSQGWLKCKFGQDQLVMIQAS